MERPSDPVFGKYEPRPALDFKRMHWRRFLKLRQWAQEIADKHQAPVYLVGSALKRARPRDIDISLILPVNEYEQRFGPVPPLGGTPEMNQHLGAVRRITEIDLDAVRATDQFQQRVDVKICPDSWWPDHDRLLLAVPHA